MSASTAIESLAQTSPAAVRLAESVAFAVMIDRAFLRAARLALVPPVDAGAEADLWFSSLVQSRTNDGIVLDPAVAEELRKRMAPERVEQVWNMTAEQHAWLAPSLRIEEEIAYLSVSRAPTAREQLAERLRSVLAAMVSGGRAGLAQWAARALAMFPSAVQELPEARMLDTGTRLRLGQRFEKKSEEEPLPTWLPWLAPATLGAVSLDLELREGELEIRTTTDDRPLRIPATNPLLLEVSWKEDGKARARQVTFRMDETVTVPVGRGELHLRSIAGDEYELREHDYASERLREEIVDFSAEMERYADVGRWEEEVDRALRFGSDEPLFVVGEDGVGKTPFACALIREAQRRGSTTVIGHFFRFGDPRCESLLSAQRSLNAQLAVRFGLGERVLQLTVSEALALVPDEEPVLIVIDDLDAARDHDRRRVSNPLEILGIQSGPVIATARPGKFDGRHLELKPIVSWDEERIEEALLRLREDRVELGIIAAMAVALRPLPQAVFGALPRFLDLEALVSTYRGDVEIASVHARRSILQTIGADETVEAQQMLVRLLRESRSIESVDRYYLFNAPLHLMYADDFDGALKLMFDPGFMTAKAKLLGVDTLIADFITLRGRERLPVDGISLLLALQQSASWITSAPDDLPTILFGYLTGIGYLPDTIEKTYGIAPPPFAPSMVPAAASTSAVARGPRKHDDAVRGSVVSPDGLITWSDDQTVRIWPEERAGAVRQLTHSAAITAFEVRHPLQIAADAGGYLYVWYGPTFLSRVWAHKRAIDGMLVDLERSLIVTWSGNDPIRLWKWNRATRQISADGELAGHSSVIAGCALMPDGLLLSASRGGTCKLWRIAAKTLLGSVSLSGPAAGIAFHWSPNARFVLTEQGTLDVVQVAQSSIAITSTPIQTGHELPLSGLAISPDGRFAATWSEDQSVRLWDVPMVSEPRFVFREHRAAVTACRFADDRPWLITGAADGTAIIWNAESGKVVSRFEGHLRAIRTISIMRGGTVCTAGDEGIVLRWDGESGTLIRDESKVPGRIAECATSASHAVLTDGETTVDRADLPEALRLEGFVMNRPRLGHKSGRRLLIYAADGSNAYWLEGDEFHELPRIAIDPHFLMAGAMDDRGTYAFGTAGGAVRLFVDQRPMRLPSHVGRVSGIAFSNDEPFIASAGYDGMLHISNSETGDPRHSIRAHRSRILTLDVRGTLAVTGSAAGALRVWDLRSGALVESIAVHDAEVTGCRLLGNGRIVSRSLDRTIRVHSADAPPVVCHGHRDTITQVDVDENDGAIYSCSEDRTIRRWSFESGEQTAIVYGVAPFRCLSLADEVVIAGDDNGALWMVGPRRVVTEAVANVCLISGIAPEERTFVAKLRRDLAKFRIETTVPVDDMSRANAVLVVSSSDPFAREGLRHEIEMALVANRPLIAIPLGAWRGDNALHAAVTYRVIDFSVDFDRALLALVRLIQADRL